MLQQNIIRVWKDEAYRLSLSTEELAQLPPNPAGLIELGNEDLDGLGLIPPTAPSLCRGCVTRSLVTRCYAAACNIQ